MIHTKLRTLQNLQEFSEELVQYACSRAIATLSYGNAFPCALV